MLWHGHDGRLQQHDLEPHGQHPGCVRVPALSLPAARPYCVAPFLAECGMSLAAWQAQGGDPGTTATTFPPDAAVIAAARALLGVPAAH